VLKNIIICKEFKEHNNEKEYYVYFVLLLVERYIYVWIAVYRIDIFGFDRLKTNNTWESHHINITWSEFFFSLCDFSHIALCCLLDRWRTTNNQTHIGQSGRWKKNNSFYTKTTTPNRCNSSRMKKKLKTKHQCLLFHIIFFIKELHFFFVYTRLRIVITWWM